MIAQYLLLHSSRGWELAGQSEPASFELEEFLRRTAVAYGLPGESGFEATFALPFGEQIVVASVIANQSLFAMRFLVVPAEHWEGDPFALTDRHPFNVSARGTLPPLVADPASWPRVEELQAILREGDSPFLLGAAQALLDGTRIRIADSTPRAKQLRGLWQLLPDAVRRERWPCDFCPCDQLPFHIAVTLSPSLPRGTINEEQTKDYPPARYEMNLQAAVEAGDQRWVDELLSRRSPRDVLRMALALLAFAVVAAVALRLLKD